MIDESVVNLVKQPRWTDPIDMYVGEIIEYDMVDGGFSILKEENLLPPKELRRLETIPKGFDRNEAVGKLKYSKDPAIKDTGKKLELLFGKYRHMFADANDLELTDIFSIKRDALFLKHYVARTEFGEYIKFKEKHQYDIYILLGKDELVTNYKSRHKTYEVYYNQFLDDISVKGIKDEKINQYHMDYMIGIIKKYLHYIIQFDFVGATKYIVKVIDDYKFFRLPVGCYREFNDESLFRIQIEGKEFSTEEADASVLPYLDVRYNFNHILVPMLNLASLGTGKNVQSRNPDKKKWT